MTTTKQKNFLRRNEYNTNSINNCSRSSVHSFKDSVDGYSWINFQKMQFSTTHKNIMDSKLSLGTEFVERQCTSKFGFLTEVSRHQLLANGSTAIPNLFDGALIMNIMTSAGITLSPLVTNCIKDMLERNQSEVGLWNFFPKEFKIIPDDVDSASIVTLALSACGWSKDSIVTLAKNIFNKAVLYNDGLVDVYFPKQTGENTTLPQMLSKWLIICRVDIVVTANLLHLLTQFQVDHLPQLAGSYGFINQALDLLLKQDYGNTFLRKHAKNYRDVDVICFFISRLLESTYACNLFNGKLSAILKERLQLDCTNPISMACKIMGGINAGLHDNPKTRNLIINQCKKLLDIQNSEDFSFPKAGLYNAHGVFHFGSSALSTAFAMAALTTAKNHIPIIGNMNMTI